MGIVKTQSIKNSVWIYAGLVIGYLNLIILMPYAFDTEKIGLIKTFQSFSILVASFAQLGIPSILLRFIPFYKDNIQQHKQLINLCFKVALFGLITSLSTLIVFSSFFQSLFPSTGELFTEYYYFLLPILISLTLMPVLEAYQASFFKTVSPNFLRNVVLRTLITVSIISFLLFELTFTDFLFLFLFSHILVVLLNFILSIKLFPKAKKSKIQAKISSFEPNKILKYGAYSLLGTGSAMVVGQIDSLMVASLKDLSSAGIYSIAFFIGVVVEIPKRAFSQTLNPLIATAWKNLNLLSIKDSYIRTSIVQIIISLFLFLCIWSNIDFIFKLMPRGDIFIEAKYVVLWIMISKIIDMAAGINNEIIGYSSHYTFNIKALLFLIILSFITNLVFIPIYGLTGAAFASFLSYLVFNLIKLIFIWLKFDMQPFTFKTLIPFCASIAIYLVLFFLPTYDNIFLAIFVNVFTISILYLPILYFLKVSEDFNELIHSVFSKIIR